MKIEIMMEKKWKENSEGIELYSKAFSQKKKAVFMAKEVMDNYDTLYDEAEIKEYSSQVFQSTNL